MIADLPGPYSLWAVLVAALLGTPGFIVARFADTGSLDQALALFPLVPANVITYNLANFGLTLYALLGIRFMRRRTLAAQAALAPILPEAGQATGNAFARVTQIMPPLFLMPILLVVSFAAYPDQVQDITGPAYLVVRVIGLPLVYFVYATFIWVYLSSIRCLECLGREPLRLRSFLEDSHLGLKPFGSLSLFLALVYFVGLVLVAFSFIALPPLFIALLAALAVPGIVLFFLPLQALHRRMVVEGGKADRMLAAAYERARPLLDPIANPGGPAPPDGAQRLMALQILEHRAGDLSRWPLDLRTMSWFSAIVLSVAAAIVTRYVLTYLGG